MGKIDVNSVRVESVRKWCVLNAWIGGGVHEERPLLMVAVLDGQGGLRPRGRLIIYFTKSWFGLRPRPRVQL